MIGALLPVGLGGQGGKPRVTEELRKVTSSHLNEETVPKPSSQLQASVKIIPEPSEKIWGRWNFPFASEIMHLAVGPTFKGLADVLGSQDRALLLVNICSLCWQCSV